MEEEKKPIPNKNMRIVGINLAVLAGYTIICALGSEQLLVLDMYLFGIHVVVCIFGAIIFRKWSWLLSAVLILVIGFSTCVMIATMH
ncbi:hypothetical protein SAMN05216464_10352 [Mucilaginibacter pineti]|uniref:Uncharacterized protein n=1 Tax=Mucilaginibacter pineti TaxID=1391627 RepID=A0A1G6YPV0_9SPHI|nr:hypothetical protein [Mucilaginibacter pineti]SDD92341.1 hypothetical protein SAMN05216464_10352 [Mucilaginibacter pineti]